MRPDTLIRAWRGLLSTLLGALLLPGLSLAAGQQAKKPQGPPPMLVTVSEIETGTAQPMLELVGTVRYVRVSRVAGEMAGIVETLDFTEGERVTSGQQLLQLNSDLLETGIARTRASHEQVLVELKQAQKDLQRIASLYREESVAEVVYDENHYRVMGLEKRAAALKADLDRQLLEKQKTSIRAPFGGLVLEKLTEQGEWVAAGAPVAVIADDSEVEVVVDAPQKLLGYLKTGRQIDIRVAGRQLQGRFDHFVPRGNVATRTFEVKLKLPNRAGLVEGMEAKAMLPAGEQSQGLLIPRDALVRMFGKESCFIVVDGKAKMVPVRITGYRGMQVAVEGEGLATGQQVVTKGNERIRDGQAVRFTETSDEKPVTSDE